MAFDFPSSPAEGQVFTAPGGPSYVFNSPVWKAVGQGQIAIISDTPPASPANGALWYESDSGVLYIWYNDGNSSQWVQVGGIMQPPAVEASGVFKVAGGTTAVTQASTTFAIPTGYQAFELFIDNVVVNGLTSLYLNYSWDGGATFPQGGSQYNYAGDKLDSSTGAGAWVGTGGASDSAYIAFAVGVSTLRPNIKAMWQVPAAGELLSGHAFAVYSTGSALRFDRTAFCSNAVAGPPTHGRFAVTGGFTIAAGCKWQLNGVK